MLHDAAPKQTRLQQWLRIDSQQKPKVYAQIFNTAEIYNLNYWLEIVLSAGIAALGLVLNSPAVIIGAMLISPLMGPIMAAGLALAAGDLYLAVKAIASLAASVSLAVAFSALIVWLLPFHSMTGEILARPTLPCSTSVSPCSPGWLVPLRSVALAEGRLSPLCQGWRSRSHRCLRFAPSASGWERRKHPHHGRSGFAFLDKSSRHRGKRICCVSADGHERAGGPRGD